MDHSNHLKKHLKDIGNAKKQGMVSIHLYKKSKNCRKTTRTTKYTTSRNDGHTPHSPTHHHHISWRTKSYNIFMDCLHVLYLLNTQIKHPTLHNSLLDKKTSLNPWSQCHNPAHKSPHANINGNEQVDKLAKLGCELDHRDPAMPHEHAHPTSYYLQIKD